MPPSTPILLGSHRVNFFAPVNNNPSDSLIMVLHGRGNKAMDVEDLAIMLVNAGFAVVTFDGANHGERIVDGHRNQAWDRGNLNHAFDMWTQMLAASHSIEVMIETLWVHVGKKTNFRKFATVGVSQGAHSNLLSAVHLPHKVHVVVSLIGSADFATLMQYRYHQLMTATKSNEKLPHLPSFDALCPPSFMNGVVRRFAAIHHIEAFHHVPLLLCVGEHDDLVPPAQCIIPFHDALKKASCPVTLFVQPGGKHHVTLEMKNRAVSFLLAHLGDSSSTKL